jgi:hypothetical protein
MNPVHIHPISATTISILFPHRRLGLPVGLISGFATKILLLLLLLLFTAIGFSPGGSSPYTSTHNTNGHIIYMSICCIACNFSSFPCVRHAPPISFSFDFFYGSTAWATSFRRGFMITHISDTPQSVGLHWTRDQLDAETST